MNESTKSVVLEALEALEEAGVKFEVTRNVCKGVYVVPCCPDGAISRFVEKHVDVLWDALVARGGES